MLGRRFACERLRLSCGIYRKLRGVLSKHIYGMATSVMRNGAMVTVTG